jgi:hypothetical protein
VTWRDDEFAPQSSASTRIGRVRPPTLDELGRPDDLLRPDAVIGLVGAPPIEASDLEVRVSTLIDGVRPVARIKKKSGLSSQDTRKALAALRGRKLLTLVGIVEETVGPWAEDIASEIAEREKDEATLPRARTDFIPAHVMAEIQAMLQEEDRSRRASELLDDSTSYDGDLVEKTSDVKPLKR